MSDSLDDWGGAEFVLAADRLDTPDVIEVADPGDMLREIASSAAAVRTALRSCEETDLSAFTPDARPRAIIVAGLGGSGVAGEIGRRHRAGQPGPGPGGLVAAQAERLPGWVGAADAVIAVSGLVRRPRPWPSWPRRRGAAAGGRRRARGLPAAPPRRTGPGPVHPGRRGRPDHSTLPRSRLWGLAIPLLVIAERLGVARVGAEVYEQASSRLEEVSHQCRPASESFVNPGKSLALDLVGTLPLVRGTSALSAVAARRFASQLSENAKYPAIVGVLPEAAHNQIAAFDGPFAPAARPSPGPAEAEDLPDLSSWDPDYGDTRPGFTPLRLVLIVDPDRSSGSRPSGVPSPNSPDSAGSACPSWPWTASIRWSGWPASSSWPTTRACTWPSPPGSTPAGPPPPPRCRRGSSSTSAVFLA